MSEHNLRMLGQAIRELAVAVKRQTECMDRSEQLLEEIRDALRGDARDPEEVEADWEVVDDEDE